MRGRGAGRRLPHWALGLIMVVVIAVASFFAYTKKLPWHDPYEIRAVFTTAQNVRVDSPVRIAGVDVGEVTEVETLTSDDPEYEAATGESAPADDPTTGEQAAVVTMAIEEEGLPIHEDATLKLEPRLFLEGNLLVNLQPGSPNSPEIEEGHTFSIDQTATSVQLDQILTTLQSDVRADLQTFLDQFGNALIKYGGAEGFREFNRSSAGAYEFTSQVNDALLGTEPHDLSGLIRNLDQVVAALGRNEAELQSLVTNFRIFTGSFAAQDAALEASIAELPRVLDAAEPAFDNLNAAFPPLRAFAREALPGTRSTPEAIDTSLPFLRQLRLLMAEDELRGLVADLRPTVPDLARLAKRTVPFLRQSRALASCFNEVIIPWGYDRVDPPGGYPHGVHGAVFEETGYSLVGIAGESRSGDANGEYVRVQAGGGPNTVVFGSNQSDFGQDTGERAFGLLQFDILGSVPDIDDSNKTPFRPDVRCETQAPPDLSAGAGPAPTQPDSAPGPLPKVPKGMVAGMEELRADAEQVEELRAAGSDREAERLEGEIQADFAELTERYTPEAEEGG